MDQGTLDRTGLVKAMFFVLVAKMRHRRLDHPAGRIPKSAKAASTLEPLLDAIK
jgi:hypothetical protein